MLCCRFAAPYEILPGDEILTTCEYNSMSTNKTTKWGNATDDEMCFAFIWYYPRQSLRQPMCNSFKTVPKCFIEDGEPYEGCNYLDIFRGTDIKWLHKAYRDLVRNCDERRCLDSCVRVVEKLRLKPCLRGDIYEFIIDQLDYMLVSRFHRLYTSCDKSMFSILSDQISSNFAHTIHNKTSEYACIVLLSVIKVLIMSLFFISN